MEVGDIRKSLLASDYTGNMIASFKKDITAPIIGSGLNIKSSDEEVVHVVRELLLFEHGLAKMPLGDMLKALGNMLYFSISLIPSIIGRSLIDTSGLVFFNLIGDTETQTIFGLYDAFYFLTYFCLVISLMDKFSIDMAVAFGEKKYAKVKEIFTKSGLVCLVFLFCFTLPLFVFAGPILKLMGVEEIGRASWRERV